jgi:hypothetical protein
MLDPYRGGMTGRTLDPDTTLEIALIGRAQLHTALETPVAVAVSELRELAGARVDLLASAAGSHLGTYLGDPRATDPQRLLAGTLLVLAGADPDLVGDDIESVRRWTARPGSLGVAGGAA